MKVLGINGSPWKNRITGKLIAKILNWTRLERERIQLAGKMISPCICCLACVKDNVYKIKDDMQLLREKSSKPMPSQAPALGSERVAQY